VVTTAGSTGCVGPAGAAVLNLSVVVAPTGRACPSPPGPDEGGYPQERRPITPSFGGKADIRLPLTVRHFPGSEPPVWAFIDTGRVSQRTACEQINARLRLIKLTGKACCPVSGHRQRGNKLMTVHLQLVRPSDLNKK
jgi:hypothetical protein